jgi:hypothetical protein
MIRTSHVARSADSHPCGTIENQVEVRALPQAQFQLGVIRLSC